MSRLSDKETESILEWVDSVPMTRPKRSLSRDFSDGVMVAEIIHHFIPKFIELHNYSASNSTPQKRYTWQTLREKVLIPRFGIKLEDSQIDGICSAKPGMIEMFLVVLRSKIQESITSLETFKQQQEKQQ